MFNFCSSVCHFSLNGIKTKICKFRSNTVLRWLMVIELHLWEFAVLSAGNCLDCFCVNGFWQNYVVVGNWTIDQNSYSLIAERGKLWPESGKAFAACFYQCKCDWCKQETQTLCEHHLQANLHTDQNRFISFLCPNRSLERKLQRPRLAKSRTLPSIPQSPTVSRVHQSDLIGGSPPHRTKLPSSPGHPKACTLPSAGKERLKTPQYTAFFLF